MILQFVIKAFEEESSLLLPEVYDRYKLLLHKNDLNIVIDSDKDMSKLLHFTQLIFDMLKSVLGRALLCYVPKKKNLGRLIYRNDADVLGTVLAVDDRHVAFCEYNGSVARIICVAVATLANEKLLERASDNDLLLCRKSSRIKRIIDNDLIDV
jgi:hypothetical protein